MRGSLSTWQRTPTEMEDISLMVSLEKAIEHAEEIQRQLKKLQMSSSVFSVASSHDNTSVNVLASIESTTQLLVDTLTSWKLQRGNSTSIPMKRSQWMVLVLISTTIYSASARWSDRADWFRSRAAVETTESSWSIFNHLPRALHWQQSGHQVTKWWRQTGRIDCWRQTAKVLLVNGLLVN